MWESCRTMPLVGGVFFFRGSPVSPAFSFQRCSMLASNTLIDSQDLDVKSLLCILEPQLCVHWLLPHTWQLWDSQGVPSAIGSEACRAGLINCDPTVKLTSQQVCNGVPRRSLVSGRSTFSFSRLHSAQWFLLRVPSAYSTEQAPAYRPFTPILTLQHATGKDVLWYLRDRRSVVRKACPAGGRRRENVCQVWCFKFTRRRCSLTNNPVRPQPRRISRQATSLCETGRSRRRLQRASCNTRRTPPAVSVLPDRGNQIMNSGTYGKTAPSPTLPATRRRYASAENKVMRPMRARTFPSAIRNSVHTESSPVQRPELDGGDRPRPGRLPERTHARRVKASLRSHEHSEPFSRCPPALKSRGRTSASHGAGEVAVYTTNYRRTRPISGHEYVGAATANQLLVAYLDRGYTGCWQNYFTTTLPIAQPTRNLSHTAVANETQGPFPEPHAANQINKVALALTESPSPLRGVE
ncbi:hypothetical protein PR048_032559 [Dryococelus australis]|uniref:Uncharacterized protein n=1 Tax=Dryococelus australis TaxID=614101 RepID=A0ABQ9G5P2_9NEOP|nr:hypothetical protein PR048_032559 [Dryococelus australis]